MFNYRPVLKTIRSNTEDAEFFGWLGVYPHFREAFPKHFFLRSLAKPIQASVMADFGLEKVLTSEEIAVSASSHTGESEHTEVIRGLLKKFDLKETLLKCGVHEPLSKNVKETGPITNNCSGKHALMLAICKHANWDTEGYLDFEHPLQKLIKQRHKELCEYTDLSPTLDGCKAPVYGMPLENIAKGFLEVFKNYPFLKSAFKKHPRLVGGEGRVDTQIMELSPDLVAKVGAGGLLAVLNEKEQRVLLIKMSQDNNEARSIVASSALKKLGWLNQEFAQTNLYTNDGTLVGKYVECLDSFI